jgi:thioredoxin reductase (NADPH)
VIVGAGPAGLHAGTYLGRFRRRIIIFNGGKPRAEWIPITYNLPGFPQGITGVEILRLQRRQCERYGAEIRREEVIAIAGIDGNFTVKTAQSQITTHKVLLATGVKDVPPNVPNAGHFKGTTIRHCPICDAYEACGRRMVIFGFGDRAAREAIWLSHYTDDLTILTTGLCTAEDISPWLRELLRERHIRILEQPVVSIEENGDQLGTITLADGIRVEDVYRGYSAMGLLPNVKLASSIGVELDDQGYILVGHYQITSVPGVYAAGDVVSGDLGQISVAAGHAATAATAIHDSMTPP